MLAEPNLQLPAAVLERLEEYLTLRAGNRGRLNSALAVGWTPRQLRDAERVPGFQEAVASARELGLESIEEKAYELAEDGNVPMIQMILYCHGADRGWRPPTQRVAVQHQGTITVERIQAVTSAARQLMQQHGGKSLALGALEGDDDDIAEAEIVGD